MTPPDGGDGERGSPVTRRGFLAAAGTVGLIGLVPVGRLQELAAAPATGAPGQFLDARELATLRSVTARLVPGPPDDPDPGALEAGAAEAIDMLLAAFRFDPPLIHAGGPYSNRAGSSYDFFARFHPLDRLSELGWRIRIEGSLGRPEREFAGAVRGLQQIYREGLAHLDERAGPEGFAALPGPAQDLILSDQSDGAVQELVGAALANTLEAVYGAPEYGGNRQLAGWKPLRWPGDVQPRGYRADEVTGPDPTAAPPPVPGPAGDQRLLDGLLSAAAGRPAAAATWWSARRGATHG